MPAAEELVLLLSQGKAEARKQAGLALGFMGEKASLVAPALAKALTHMDYNVRRSASEAIDRLGSDALQIAAPLGKLLSHEDENVRLYAATALCRMGGYSKPAAGDLSRALVHNPSNWHETSAWQLRVTCARTLGFLDGDGVESLVKALEDEVDDVRGAAAEALGRLPEELASQYQGKLRRLFNDMDPEVRTAAKRTMQSLQKLPAKIYGESAGYPAARMAS